MTDTPPKPKRRRWRWLVAGMLLLVVAPLFWSYWRRLDQRFVGTWQVYSDERLVPVVNTFFADGTARTVDTKTGKVIAFSWQANNDVFSTWPDNVPRCFRDTLDSAIRRITSPHLVGYDVLSISGNEIKMWTRNPRNQQSLVTFRRIGDAPVSGGTQ